MVHVTIVRSQDIESLTVLSVIKLINEANAINETHRLTAIRVGRMEVIHIAAGVLIIMDKEGGQ